MIYNPVSGLYLQKRCCTAVWVAQDHATVCTTQSCLERALSHLSEKVLKLIEIKTYHLEEE